MKIKLLFLLTILTLFIFPKLIYAQGESDPYSCASAIVTKEGSNYVFSAATCIGLTFPDTYFEVWIETQSGSLIDKISAPSSPPHTTILPELENGTTYNVFLRMLSTSSPNNFQVAFASFTPIADTGSPDWQCGYNDDGECVLLSCSCTSNKCSAADFKCTQGGSGCFPAPQSGMCPDLEGLVDPDAANQKIAKGDCENGFIDSAVGCSPYYNMEALRNFWLTWGIGIAGGIAFILISIAGYQLLTSKGDPDKVASAKNLITAAITGLIMLVFIPFIISFAGVEITGILPRVL